MKILKICLLLFVVISTFINGLELKYTDIKISVYNNTPRFPSFNSDALKPLNFSLEGFDFIGFNSDIFKMLNFNYKPYVPIKAWLTIEATTNAINLYIKESKGHVCYTFTKEQRELLLKNIDTYINWSKQSTQKKILANKEIGGIDIQVKFRSHDTWHTADQISDDSGNIVPLLTTRFQSFEPNKHMFVLRPKSLKHKGLAVFSPTELFFFQKELETFKKILDQRKIDAIIRINKEKQTAQDNLK